MDLQVTLKTPFQKLTNSNKGVFKLWMQNDYVERLPQSFEDGACFAISVIYLYRNFVSLSGSSDGEALSNVQKTSVFGLGIVFDVLGAVGSLLFSNAPPKKQTFGTFMASDASLGPVHDIQTAEHKRREAESKMDDDKGVERIASFNAVTIGKLTNGLLKPYGETLEMDLDEIDAQELGDILERLSSPGFHLIDTLGHTQAAVVKNGKYKYLDPNEGQAIFREDDDMQNFARAYLCESFDGLVHVYSFK